MLLQNCMVLHCTLIYILLLNLKYIKRPDQAPELYHFHLCQYTLGSLANGVVLQVHNVNVKSKRQNMGKKTEMRWPGHSTSMKQKSQKKKKKAKTAGHGTHV